MRRLCFLWIMLLGVCQAQIKGIWESEDKLLFFGDTEITAIYKLYYSWYYDTVSLKNTPYEKRNAATSSSIYNLTYETKDNNGVTELYIYSGSTLLNIIPYYIEDTSLYLSFLTRGEGEANLSGTNGSRSLNNQDISGFFYAINEKEDIRISSLPSPENIFSYFFTDNGIYRIRYWKTEMDKEDSMNEGIDDKVSFVVPKHIYSAGQNYASSSGRSKRLRNLTKEDLPRPYKLSTDKNHILFGNPKYTRLTGGKEVLSLVEEANKRRKESPKPLFPDMKVNFYWELIDLLENNNQIIREFRKTNPHP